ncbi:hypothetical protein V6N11_001626 [Hibiscus sabdariffa]|uniref:Uncharacterized protein n=2 Tax=Hibiscus sabdariffa TaxID=183260 RepID=A0ABR2NJW9_9ROSI
MAIEARQNTFPPSVLRNHVRFKKTRALETTKCFHFESSLKSIFLYRKMMNPIETNENLYQAEMEFGVSSMTAVEVTATEGLFPLYNSLVNDKKFTAATTGTGAMKS